MFGLFKSLVLTCLAWSVCARAEEVSFDRGYLESAGGILLPGAGQSVRRAAEVQVRGGYYLTDVLALEGGLFCAPHAATGVGGAVVAGGTLGALMHLTAMDEFDKLFGSERIDPFVTFGGGAHFASHPAYADDSRRAAIGPMAGFGTFYHLTDTLSLRFDAQAFMGCGSPCCMSYALGMGLQWSFGSDAE